MKINIIFPYNIIGGAFRSTYELSNHLTLRGHDINIYIPFIPFLEGHSLFSFKGITLFIRGIIRSLIRGSRVSWFDLRVKINVVPFISNYFIRDADIIVANHWQTVESVFQLHGRKGIKFNFIRDTNPWMERPELEENSFKAYLDNFKTSSNLSIKRFGKQSFDFVQRKLCEFDIFIFFIISP